MLLPARFWAFAIALLSYLPLAAQSVASGNVPVKLPLQFTPLAAKVNLSQALPDFGAFMANTHVIHQPGVNPGKDEFMKWKAEANALAEQARGRAGSEPAMKTNQWGPPTVGNSFFGHGADEIPNDNAIAVSPGGKVLSSMNTQVRVYNTTGGAALLNATFTTFSSQAGLGNAIKFDPKVLYDPVHDRFILVFLYGDQPSSSRSVICFSETNDPAGNWNVYAISGNLNNLGVWADFPQIGISNDELFLTCNLFTGSSFTVTGVWQCSLADGYAGNTLTNQPYAVNYFSLHPVTGGSAPYGPHFYFLSHQSSASSNSIYVHKITGNLASNPTMNAAVTMTSNIGYGIPPSADQRNSNTMLQTNDCRVQSSYFENNRIQFTLNTGVGGRPGVFYGTLFISPLGLSFSQLTAFAITHPTYELAYGSVAYAGSQAPSGDNASFVGFNFCSPNDFPGHGAVYLDGTGAVSEFRVVKTGSGSVGFGGEWRWGDYADMCELDSGHVWMTGSYGNGSTGTGTWLSELFLPQLVGTAPVVTREPELSVYPNPTTETVHFDFPVAQDGFHQVRLVDAGGRTVEVLVERNLAAGDARLVFNTAPLAPGMYQVVVSREGQPIFTEKLLKQ